MSHRKNEKKQSVFFYVSIIFVVAIALIIASNFFRSKMSVADSNDSLTVNVAKLSDDNLSLQQKLEATNATLEESKNKLQESKTKTDNLQQQTTALQTQIDTLTKLNAAYNLLQTKQYPQANDIIAQIDPQSLDTDAQRLYNDVKLGVSKKLKK